MAACNMLLSRNRQQLLEVLDAQTTGIRELLEGLLLVASARCSSLCVKEELTLTI